jgi:AGCS family alanine or glycine:cation symporter
MGDTGAGLMAWLNIIAILLMSKQAIRIVKDYDNQKKLGLDPVFHPEEFGIDDPDHIWDKYRKRNAEETEPASVETDCPVCSE